MQLDQEPKQESALHQKLRTLCAEIVHEVVHIVWRLPSEPIEFILALEIIGFGLVFSNTTTFSKSAAFAAMAALAPQETWAGLAGVLGTLLMWGLLLRKPILRRWALLGMWMFWLLVTVQIFVANDYVSTGVTTYGGLAIAAAIAHLRLDLRKH